MSKHLNNIPIKVHYLLYGIHFVLTPSREHLKDLLTGFKSLRDDVLEELTLSGKDTKITLKMSVPDLSYLSQKSKLTGQNLDCMIDKGTLDFWIEICESGIKYDSVKHYEPFWDFPANQINTDKDGRKILTPINIAIIWNV